MSPTLTERRRAETMAQVSDIALALFAERGFQAVTMEDLASRAGISLRTLFRYFPAKVDLVLGPAEQVRRELESAMSGTTTLHEHEAGIERGLRDLVANPQLVAQLARIHALLGEDPSLRAAAVARVGFDDHAAVGDAHARMVSALVSGTLRTAFLTWVDSADRDDPEALLASYRAARELRTHVLRELHADELERRAPGGKVVLDDPLCP